jgi:hypothetical protein
MDISVLVEQNPWWKDKKLIEEDYDIVKWKTRKYHWMPKLVESITLEPFSLHILLGPRQVGKTTTVKLLIRKLLEDRDPRSLFYFNCEELGDYKELLEMLETYLELKDKSRIESSCIFLDEITSPAEWYRAIKSLIDKGKLKNDVVVLTGSTSISVKRQTELFPGRRGNGRDYLLFPLSFREFIRVMMPKLYEKIPAARRISAKELEEKSIQAMVFIKELDSLLEKYFSYGGFPLALEEKEEAKKAYLSWIKTEILKSRRSDIIAREILKSLLEKLQTPISWEGISKEIEIKSPKTVAAYIELLRSMFTLIVLYHVDISAGTIKFGKNKKIHFIDPLLLEIFENWCMLKLKNRESILAESSVAAHLSRLAGDIFYWRNSGEVDIIINDEGDLKGFEVKWRDKFKATHPRHLKEFVTISKNKFSTKPLVIPLSVFLAIIER